MLALIPVINSQAQQVQKLPDNTPVILRVTSTDGKPIAKAQVSIGEGLKYMETDSEGKLSFVASNNLEIVVVQKNGYKRIETIVKDVKEKGHILLEEIPVFTDADDELSLPFTSMDKRYSLGSSYLIKGSDLERVPSTDIRRSLTGLAPGLDVTENYGGPGVTSLERIGRFGSRSKVDLSMRGKTPIYMVDNIPVDVAETPLDPQQIESITIIKDLVEKTLYGPFAANGIIHIKTKRGKEYSRYLNVNYEEGINAVDRMPEFVNGEEYAKMNNIARNNSGLTMLYSREALEKYTKRDPYDKLYPNANFRDMMLKNTASYRRVNVSSGGGNDVMTYFAYLGYSGEDDIYKIGPTSNYNRINFSANLDVKLNSFIKSRFGFFSNISNRKSPNYGYNGNYSDEDGSANWTMDVIEFSRVMGHLTTIPHIAFPIFANNDPNLTRPQYAVSSSFAQNPIGNIMHNGSYTDRLRKGLISVAVDMDFSFLLKGLSTTTFFALDANNVVRLGTAEDYDAYLVSKGLDMDGNEIPVLTKSSSHSLSEMANKTKLTDYNSQRLFGHQKINYKENFGKHDVNVSADMFITKRMMKYLSEDRREVTGVFSGSYAYDKKYLFQTAMSYSGTYSLKYNRYSFSPTFAAGWLVSEEDFMKGQDFIDYLKIRTQFGVLSYDGSMTVYRDLDNYSWNNTGQSFGPHSSNQWFGSTTSGSVYRLQPGLIGNPDLRLEKRKEFNVGVEALALDRKLYLELNYYNNLHDGPVTQIVNLIPSLSGITNGMPWLNYNKTRYFGIEVAAQYEDRIKGSDFSYSIGLNATVQNSKVERYDELDYNYPYQSRVGYPAGAIFGLSYIGQFETKEETLLVPQLYDEELSIGDFKYLDMNGDGVIDDNDRCFIGNSVPKLFFGLNLNLQYKDFDLNIQGSGRAFYDIQMTNSYYWNGWGDENYSKFTLNNLGKENTPRLTYEKVNNNYKLSSYWLEDGSYFKIKNIELGWNVPVKRWSFGGMRNLRIYAKAANLLTFTKVKDVDPEAIDAGISHYPLFKTFVGGIQFNF